MLTYSEQTRDDWNRILGKAPLYYFDSLASQLKRAGFKDDDMSQEGFQDVVTKGEISLWVIENSSGGSYHEVKIEDGVSLIHTTPAKWWVNVDGVGSRILDLL